MSSLISTIGFKRHVLRTANSMRFLNAKRNVVTGDFFKQNTFYTSESPLVGKIDNDKQLPLAILLGWAGSSDKHVAKYADIYKRFGYHTIRLAPTTRLSVFQFEKHKPYAIELLDLISQKKQSPIVVHTFSNAGTFFYRYVSELVQNDDKYKHLRPNFKSMIFDSGPGLTDEVRLLIKSIAELVEQKVKVKSLAYLIAFTGYLTHRLMPGKYKNIDENFKKLEKDQLLLPTLFLYSKKDYFISYKHIEKFIEKRSKFSSNIKIDSILFEDSEHCMHYLRYKNVYLNKIKDHLSLSKLPIYDA